MRSAHYSVIRYIPDPARNEALNVGILLWDGADSRLRIDAEAVQRVIRENPRLATHGLDVLETMLRDALALGTFDEKRLLKSLDAHTGFPVSFTEPRFTMLPDDQPAPLDVNLERLIKRVVRPRRRTGGGGVTAAQFLERQLRPLIQRNAVDQNHVFQASKTGVARRVHFFANSGTNPALDTLRLDLQKAAAIMERADAEAFKVEDVLAMNRIEFMVYCDFSSSPYLRDATQSARRIITSAGAKVITDLVSAAQTIEAAVTASPPRADPS
jgi:hypothetical protein